MEQLPLVPSESSGVMIVRSSGQATPFNAGDAVAVAVEVWGSPIGPTTRARLGKAAKGCLDAGMDAQVVCAAVVEAIRHARPHLVESFALEIQTAREGRRESFRDLRRRLDELNATNNPAKAEIMRILEGVFRR